MSSHHQFGIGFATAIKEIKQWLLPVRLMSHQLQIVQADQRRRFQTLKNSLGRKIPQF